MPTSTSSAQPDLLLDAMLLATTGGLLDAVVYLNHGHVFVNAMTGNVIFLGVAVLSRDWADVVPHVVPLFGFLAGVIMSKHLRSRVEHRSALLGLGFETIALFILGLVPDGPPNMAFSAIIAYVVAFQVASFRRVGRFPYNSTFITGNLRDMAEGLYDSFAAGDKECREMGRAQALHLGLICLCFLLGAIIGGWAAPRFGNRSLWMTEPFLLTVALRSVHRSLRQR